MAMKKSIALSVICTEILKTLKYQIFLLKNYDKCDNNDQLTDLKVLV